MLHIERIALDSENLDDLKHRLPKLIGTHVQFSNGYEVVLVEDAGCYWGDTPEGNILCIEAGSGWEQSLLNLLVSWNKRTNNWRSHVG